MSHSISTIPCGFEVVLALFWWEEVADASDEFPEGFIGSCSPFSEEGFQLCECHLDGVEVGGVGRQEDQRVALRLQEGLDALRFVRGQVVVREARAATGSRPRRKDLAGAQRGGEAMLDIRLETRAVHRPIQNPGGDQSVMTEPRDEGLCIPVSEGSVVDQALADRGPACGLDKVGLEACLVNEHQHFQHVGHVWLATLNPVPAPLDHVGPQLLTGQQSFFYG